MSVDIKIDMLGGNCPVQGEGTINGVPFYFRARGEHWSMSIGEDPVGISVYEYKKGWYKSEPWGDEEYAAGWMPVKTAKSIIEKCAEEFAKG